MNCTQKLIGICDQLIAEIEAGDVDAAILQLSGTLDGAIAAGASGRKLRDFLATHPISAFLEIGDQPIPGLRSTVGRISNARAKIASEKALQLRREKLTSALNGAWRKGAKICSFDSFNLTDMKSLAGRDLTNIEFLKRSDLGAEQEFRESDVILAANMADKLSTTDLHSFLKLLPAKMSARGRILISFFLPGHSGLGWRITRNPSSAFCHDEREIRSIATSEGLSINTYFDPGGCMVWAELRHKLDREIGGEKSWM